MYHKVHSAGWGNVWCSHCDWRQQPPLLIPPVLLHDISGKDIPLLVKPSLVLLLFSVHPPFFDSLFSQFLSIIFCFPISFSSFFLHSLFQSLPLFLFPPSCPTNMAVFGFVGSGRAVCVWVGLGGVGAEIITMTIHIKTVHEGMGGRVFAHFQSCKSRRRLWERSLMLI